MISIPNLVDRLVGGRDWVLVDLTGEPLSLAVPNDIGPATFLVTPVADAVKTMTDQGLIDESLNRDHLWAITGYALNRVVLERLDSEDMSHDELVDAVTGLGLGWQFKPLAEIGPS